MINVLKKNYFLVIVFVLVCINFFLIKSIFNVNLFKINSSQKDVSSLSLDLTDFNSKNIKNFKEMSDYFSALAEKRGAEYAFDLLKIIPPASGIDMHLLGHKIGDVLYKQEGINGIYKCTQDFRNACSHTIVVGILFDKGEKALSEIADVCRKAPGGSGAYTMCFHGLGHGVLAYNDYNLEKTMKMCEKNGTSEFGFRESSECVGGAIMEMIGGGFHDEVAWKKERPKYISNTNPLSPCSLDIVPKDAKEMCYAYLTPHLFEAAGANLGNPNPITFNKAFNFCDKISSDDISSRRACFGGFGKEFIVLAKDRDIRNMNNFTKEELNKVHKWCALSKLKDGEEFCMNSAVTSLFWGGENNSQVAIDFCSSASNVLQKSCFDVLLGNAHQYLTFEKSLSDFCQILPESYKQECLKK